MRRSTLERWFAGTGSTTATSTQPNASTVTSTNHPPPTTRRSAAEKDNTNNHNTAASNKLYWASIPSSTTSTTTTTTTSPPAGGLDLAVPTPTSSHSLSSPSPSPQPATPVDQSFDRNICFGTTDAAASSKPVDIASPRIRTSYSASPQAAITHERLTSAIDIPGTDRNAAAVPGFDHDNDVEMTTGPALDSALGRGRRDSFVSAGPKPISMINPNRDQANRGRRESLAGSLMNGMSWGGVSVGSFIKDDLMMAGTSPWSGAPQSSSFHSNSYIPKMEADYLRNFLCCNQQLETFHDLLRHYETMHTGPNAQQNNQSGITMPTPIGAQVPHRLSTSRQSLSSAAISNGRQNSQGFHNQGQMGFGQQNRNGSGTGFSNIQMGGQAQSSMGSNAQKQSQLANLQSNDEMDALGDMEMDDAVGPMEMDDSTQRAIQQTRQMFGQQQRPQLQLNSTAQGLRTSQPTTPGTGNTFSFQNNPTVSSVNTPTLSTHGMDDELSTMGNDMNIGDFGALDSSGLEYFINNPAKSLYSPNDGPANQRALQQQMAQFGLDASQFPNISDPNHILALQRAIANPGSIMIPPEEDKPFKCPVIGCEKAYKNQNGLKYHKQHGHQNQQLHENGDGTFSIVNPETSAPYPGETGMEKEKPHKCEYCHKRYKNLNGLKYHKQHSTPCEIAAQAASLRAGMASGQMSFNNLSHGLPGIGEEMQI
ncbi:hypothetical protein DL767_006973 [Monosporascus sp. MG133]|nr:hypothetical protein DL767_006973 [Monosporascus sp. MG133]